MTIAGGLICGLAPVDSAKFSFLIAIPAIAGAGLLEGLKIMDGSFPEGLLMPLLASMIITVIVALLSLKLLFALVRQIRIDLFGYYTIAVGIAGCAVIILSR